MLQLRDYQRAAGEKMHAATINLSGHQFGLWTVVEYAGPNSKKGGGATWLCLCRCGNTKVVAGETLRRRKSKSCGCISDELRRAGSTKHGQTGGLGGKPTGAYSSWHAMRQRCDKPTHKQYADYGGRGIKVCERWEVFENFYADMGDRPDGMTLDRWPDKDGNYEPCNCRWATAKQQTQNRRPKVKNSDMLPILDAAKSVVAANDNILQAVCRLATAIAEYEQKRAA